MFDSTAISIHMLIHTWMILIQNSNALGVTCVIIVGKCCWTKSSRNLFNNIYTWNVFERNRPKQRINRTVSTQRRRHVSWLVLEPAIGAVGLSTLRIAFGNHPLNCVILPIFLLVFNNEDSSHWLMNLRLEDPTLAPSKSEWQNGYLNQRIWD